MKRIKLLLILATMPDEAFGWILAAILTKIYPNGLGGFRTDSQVSIRAAQEEVESILNESV